MNVAECYQALGLPRGASQKEIKSAYRNLSLKYHPDRNRNQDDEKFKRINEAYQLLRREEKDRERISEKDVTMNYAEFWKRYDGTKMNENFHFGPNFGGGVKTQFGANAQPIYDHFREKEFSYRTTHMIIFGGLGVMGLWIILAGILK